MFDDGRMIISNQAQSLVKKLVCLKTCARVCLNTAHVARGVIETGASRR